MDALQRTSKTNFNQEKINNEFLQKLNRLEAE